MAQAVQMDWDEARDIEEHAHGRIRALVASSGEPVEVGALALRGGRDFCVADSLAPVPGARGGCPGLLVELKATEGLADGRIGFHCHGTASFYEYARMADVLVFSAQTAAYKERYAVVPLRQCLFGSDVPVRPSGCGGTSLDLVQPAHLLCMTQPVFDDISFTTLFRDFAVPPAQLGRELRRLLDRKVDAVLQNKVPERRWWPCLEDVQRAQMQTRARARARPY